MPGVIEVIVTVCIACGTIIGIVLRFKDGKTVVIKQDNGHQCPDPSK